MSDSVNHPAHYNVGGIEVIDAVEAWDLGFCLGNVVKYIVRSPHKGSQVEDLKKARWYLDRQIQKLEREYAAIDAVLKQSAEEMQK